MFCRQEVSFAAIYRREKSTFEAFPCQNKGGGLCFEGGAPRFLGGKCRVVQKTVGGGQGASALRGGGEMADMAAFVLGWGMTDAGEGDG